MNRISSTSSSIDPPKRSRRGWIYILTLVAALSGTGGSFASQISDDLFVRHDLVIDAVKPQTVLPGFFLGGTLADLVVVSVGDSGDRHLSIYSYGDDTWAPEIEATLRPGVLFVDVARIGGHDRLITYESGQLNWFDPDAAIEHQLVEIGTSYRAVDESAIPHVDITRDLNRDGHDDLLMPDLDGFWVSTQSTQGSFTVPALLGPSEPFAEQSVGNLDVGEPASGDSPSYGDVGITAMTIPVYLSRVHQMDYDLDGRFDLVFWNEDHFDIYLQDSGGSFVSPPQSYSPDVSIDSDGVYSRSFDYSDQGIGSILFGFGKKTERTVLHSLEDVNGDSIADLVALTMAGKSITKQRSLYEVHFGSATPDGIRFASEASTGIRSAGKAGGMQPWGYASHWFEDLDDDGQVEMILRDVRVGFGGMGRALLGNSVPIDLEFYRTQQGLYTDEPATTRKIRRFAPFDGPGNIFFPPVLMGDVNGDGRSDLVVGESPNELHVFLGQSGPDLLAQQPLRIEVPLPQDERNVRLVDLNNDRRQDILIHHPSKTEPQRVTMLISQSPPQDPASGNVLADSGHSCCPTRPTSRRSSFPPAEVWP